MKISGFRFLTSKGLQTSMMAAIALACLFAGESPAALRHNYLFNSGNGTTAVDSVSGGLNGSAIGGTIDIADSRFVLDGTDNYVDFDGAALAINTYGSLTLELWSLVSPIHEGQYTASVAFGGTSGGTGVNYIMMQPTRGGAEGSSGQIIDVSTNAEARVTGPVDLADGRIHHTVLTISATEVAYYVDGGLIGTAPLAAPSLSGVSTARAHLGDSVWDGDPLINGALYEFRIYDDVKSATDVVNLFNAGCTAGCGNMYLEIDRNSGAASLVNGLSAKNLVISNISSAKGALNPTNWLSITDNYDEDDGMEVDPDDQWQIESATNVLLRELDPIGQGAEDGGVFDSDILLGNIWTKSPFEDIQVTLTVLDNNFTEQQLSVPVFFVNGPDDAPFSRSDLDVDGDIDPQDYLNLKANHLKTLTGTLHIDTFGLGDINGDLINDYRDFRLFKADYIAENGAAAFASLLASNGAIPEPSSLLLLVCGAAVGVLTARRKRGEEGVRNTFTVFSHSSERIGNRTCISKFFFLFAFLLTIPSLSHAQAIVMSETFDARADTAGIGVEGGATTLTLVNQGGSDNALQFTATSAAGGFFASGFTIPALGVEPGPGGPNISSNLTDYRLSFDLTINAINGFTPNLEIWLADGPRFSTNNANLYTAGALTNGVNNISFTLNQNLTTTVPNGFTSPGGAWLPSADDWWIQVNSISFGAPAGATVDYTIDNIQVTVDVVPSLALVVDPVSGKARIRNVSAGDVTLDYYRIESTNGSLLTANYNGTTGWNSLDDQNLGAIGGGVGESWEEVTAANSSNRLIEQYLAGATTLQPGQSVAIGAPVNPTILNNQLGSLAFRIGGEAYADVAIAQVKFETLTDLLVGDYNQNGTVDAADYTLWRNRVGQPSNSLPNRDPENSGNIGPDDYASWKSNFGAVLGAGSGASGLSGVPEPAAGVLFVLAICLASGCRCHRTGGIH